MRIRTGKRRPGVALAAVALLAATVTAVAACSSGSAGGGQAAGGTQTAGGTIKLGLIADLTGPYSSSFTSSALGLAAYVKLVNAAGGINGEKLSYVTADTTSTISGALTAAQELVQQDHVFAVIADSAVFSGASAYLLQQGVPAVGAAIDGPEWNNPKNTNLKPLFASTGTTDHSAVGSTAGEFMKAQGVTSCGSIGYPNATAGPDAVGIVKSCVAAGLKNGYLNTQVPAGSTDVGPIALAIQKSGVNGIYLPIVVSTAFSLFAALKQLGVKLKVAMIATGYGGDLLASSAAVQAGQGYLFTSIGQPVEMHTPATEKQVTALAAVGVTTTPTFAEQESYIAGAAVAAGLRAAGKDPTQASFTKALRNIHNFSADGLLSPGAIDFSNFNQYAAGGGCIFAAQLEGKAFIPVKGTPVCGHTIPGLTTGA
jgi:branched-chain amino acid transport system substrate-binding protein